MRRWRGALRWTLRIALGLAAVVVVAGLGGWAALEIWLPSSLPQLTGRFEIKGITAPVSIVRDSKGVPHIYAANMEDASFALGFVHAQDRLFQMEAQRRIGAGRMSEIAGSSSVRFDRLMRVLGLYRLAQDSERHLGPEATRNLVAYTAGVNAYLAQRREDLPPEFLLIGTPEPWQPADSLVWGKLMALGLSTGWRQELMRLQLVQRAGAARAETFFPPYPEDGPTTVTRDRAALPGDFGTDAFWAMLPGALRDGGASNQWVVSGTRTASGKPLLANDPHLSFDAPSLWYLVRIETPELTLSGATVPGVPAIIIGHNGRIAWGLTTPHIDAEDLFIEKLDPADAGKYLTPEGPKPFATRKETIRVRLGSDVTMTVRETRHGPVIDDAMDPKQMPKLEPGQVLALRAAWLEPGDRTAEALLDLNRARNWDEFRAALSKYVAPAQNFVYADVDGNIGYYLPGRIPIRKAGDGSVPLPGWTGENGWTGFIPFERLPQLYNPAQGLIVNANNRVVNRDYPFFLSREWGDHFRAARIEALLTGTNTHGWEDFARIQGDHVSLMARDLLPLLLAVPAKSERGKAAQATLRGWTAAMRRDRPEGLLFTAWLANLSRRIFDSMLGEHAAEHYALAPEIVLHVLTRKREACADPKRPGRSCDDLVAESLEATLDWIERRHGGDPAKWQWGAEHFAEMRHRIFPFIPLMSDFGTLRIPADGDGRTINRADMRIRDSRAPFAARHGAGVRAIFTFDDLTKSRFIVSTGPSGHPRSPFYGNMLADWRDVRFVTLAPTRAEADKGAAGTIELVPAR